MASRDVIDAREFPQTPPFVALLEPGAHVADSVGVGETVINVIYLHSTTRAQFEPGVKTARDMAPDEFAVQRTLRNAGEPVSGWYRRGRSAQSEWLRESRIEPGVREIEL